MSDLLNFVFCRFYYVFMIILMLCDVVVVMEMLVLIRGEYFFEVKYVVFIVMEFMGVNDRVSGGNCLFRICKIEKVRFFLKVFFVEIVLEMF